MKLSYALILASSLAFFACDSENDNPAKPSDDCSVTDGVKVVSPAGGETFKIGQKITVVFGSDIDDSGYKIEFKASDKVKGVDLTTGSIGDDYVADGKTCYEQKVVLDAEKVTAGKNVFIRVVPYNKTSKYGDSKPFTIKE